MPPTELWEALSRTEDYPGWWTWLRRFQGDGLVAGGRTHCEVRAPLPYSLRFDVAIQTLEPARLEIEPADPGSAVRLVWMVEVRDPVLRAGAVFGRPLMQWGHEWVVANGVSQFRRRALASGS